MSAANASSPLLFRLNGAKLLVKKPPPGAGSPKAPSTLKSYSPCCAEDSCIGQAAKLKLNITDKTPKTLIEFLFFISSSSSFGSDVGSPPIRSTEPIRLGLKNFGGPPWDPLNCRALSFLPLDY